LKLSTVTPIHTSKEIDMQGSILILVCAVLYSVDACSKVSFDDAKEAAQGKADIEDLKEYLEDNKPDDERSDEPIYKKGQTLLMEAVQWGNYRAISLLLAKGADVNAKDHFGKTALMHASWRWNEDVVRDLLLVPGIDINNQGKFDGMTALMLAAEGGNTPNVKILLDNEDIDVNILDAKGNTALGWARNAETKKMLEQHGAICRCVSDWCRRSVGNC